MMLHYETLLEEAVTKVKAERGFIVRYNPATHQLTQFVATHQFDAVPLLQPSESLAKDYQIIQDALPLMAGQKRPVLTHTCDDKYFPMAANPHSRMADRVLRSLIVIPLHSMGLLWCDVKFKNGLFQPYDLQALLTLVQRSGL
jgi:hypothetical protein